MTEEQKETVERLKKETRHLVDQWIGVPIITEIGVRPTEKVMDKQIESVINVLNDVTKDVQDTLRNPNRPQRALKPDAQAFDEVRIITVPRYKQSGLSGDEWRISASIQFYRKGKLICESGASDIEHAAYLVGARHMEACDNANGYFAGEGDICDQEGCSEKATVTYRIKKEFSRDNGHEWNKELNGELRIRKFCNRHKTRGDQSYDDSDANYEEIPFIHTEERKQKD